MLPADCDCFKCKHYHRDEVKKPFSCEAYPAGIPEMILYGDPQETCGELKTVPKRSRRIALWDSQPSI